LSLVYAVCYQVEVSASGWSLVQRSPTECGVSEYDHESSTMRSLWSTGAVGTKEKKLNFMLCIPSKPESINRRINKPVQTDK
jgi:hypothetical protein